MLETLQFVVRAPVNLSRKVGEKIADEYHPLPFLVVLAVAYLLPVYIALWVFGPFIATAVAVWFAAAAIAQ